MDNTSEIAKTSCSFEILIYLYLEYLQNKLDPKNLEVRIYRNFVGQWDRILVPGKTQWDGIMFDKGNYGIHPNCKANADRYDVFLPEEWKFTWFLKQVLNGDIDLDNNAAFTPFTTYVKKEAARLDITIPLEDMPNKTPKKERVPGPYDDKELLKHVATTVQKFKNVAGVSEEQKQELFNTLVPHNTITDVTFDNGRLLHYLDQHYNSETGEFGDTLPPCFAVYIVESKKKIQQTREKKRAAYALRNAARGNDTLNEGWSVHEDSGDDGED